MTVFESAIIYLDALGLTDVILPFALIFTVVFALLQQAKIFYTGEKTATEDKSKPNKKVNAIIALAMSLLVVIPHVMRSYPTDSDPIIIINNILPGAIVLTIVLLIFLMVAGFVGSKRYAHESPLIGIAGLIAIVGLIIVIWRAIYPDTTPEWLWFLDNPDLQALIVIILIMGLVIYAVTSEKDDTKKTTFQKIKELYGG